MPQKNKLLPLLIFLPRNKASIPHFEVKKKYNVAEAGHKHLILTIEGMGRMYTGYTSLLFNLFSHKTTVAKKKCLLHQTVSFDLLFISICYPLSFFLYFHKILFCRKIGPVIFRLRQSL